MWSRWVLHAVGRARARLHLVPPVVCLSLQSRSRRRFALAAAATDNARSASSLDLNPTHTAPVQASTIVRATIGGRRSYPRLSGRPFPFIHLILSSNHNRRRTNGLVDPARVESASLSDFARSWWWAYLGVRLRLLLLALLAKLPSLPFWLLLLLLLPSYLNATPTDRAALRRGLPSVSHLFSSSTPPRVKRYQLIRLRTALARSRLVARQKDTTVGCRAKWTTGTTHTADPSVTTFQETVSTVGLALGVGILALPVLFNRSVSQGLNDLVASAHINANDTTATGAVSSPVLPAQFHQSLNPFQSNSSNAVTHHLPQIPKFVGVGRPIAVLVDRPSRTSIRTVAKKSLHQRFSVCSASRCSSPKKCSRPALSSSVLKQRRLLLVSDVQNKVRYLLLSSPSSLPLLHLKLRC